MSKKFSEYKGLDLTQINKEILDFWKENKIFDKSISTRKDKPEFVFVEGPPSANGLPGIHHVISRTLKDAFCRYKTLQGFKVERKAGWDTHGLPVELGTEKKLGITKEDIGKTISVADYNDTCKREVMQYTDIWEKITEQIGFWVDMENPYITYENKFIETLWWLIKQLYNKNLLYKGYTIQPYSPAAGTGLSSHELNMPGCYRDVKDTTAVAQFKVVRNPESENFFTQTDSEVYFLAWTTTPWTLLSNTALAVGQKIEYQLIRTFNPYTGIPVSVIMAKDLVSTIFPDENKDMLISDYQHGDKKIPFKHMGIFKGAELAGIRYEQLLPYAQPEEGDAFKVITGDFVTTSDGTGIVHIAPSFGADDAFVAKQNGIGALTLVDKQGKFTEDCGEFAGRYVKNSYDKTIPNEEADKIPSPDVDIVVKLKNENKLFKSAKYEHSYPHCWRTDKPILYYPLDSWFIRSTTKRQRMIELNKTINWKPASTGEGRFGMWLENLQDWNLSRSRYWGTPLPIWRTEDASEEICIGSIEELKHEIEKSVQAGFMNHNPLKDFVVGDFTKDNYEKINLHRPLVDDIYLVSKTGKKMIRETDLIDVWFDSGAVPYAQWHYPFENKELFERKFPADFIAEGIDQTRGWFFTLHAIAAMISDSVSFKNVISTGLLLDKNGVKMSKRLGNVIDPFDAVREKGADAIRWYMLTNAKPWDNLKFDMDGVDEIKRKYFGTLYNTYSFFALYANLDKFNYAEAEIPVSERPEIDRWILSLLNSLVKNVQTNMNEYESTIAGRLIQEFVVDNLSNWYVRLNRKRFWGQDYDKDKIAAYQTLYTCLETVAILSSPFMPFYSDKLFKDLNTVSGKQKAESVHLADFPKYDETLIDKVLEERMALAQDVSSMVLSLRRNAKLKVRQPLQKIMLPILDDNFKSKIEAVKNIILTEINVKEIEFLTDASGILSKKIKANFAVAGRKFGKQMKAVGLALSNLDQKTITTLEKNGVVDLMIENETVSVQLEDVIITADEVPGLPAANKGELTVALDITLTESLREEGVAREIVNKIQNLRKDTGLEVTDKISIVLSAPDFVNQSVTKYADYIKSQVLATDIKLGALTSTGNNVKTIEVDEETEALVIITKI